MLRFLFLIFIFIGFVLLQSCNTLTNTATIKLEIIIPGTVKIPSDYKKTAIAYNNSNVSSNPYFSYYFEDNKKLEDKTNVDSIASEIYFQIFVNHLKNQHFFDTIIELAPKNYSDIKLNDSLIYLQFDNHEDLDSAKTKTANFQIYNFTKFVNLFFYNDSNKLKTKFIDPEFGLYSKSEIQEIADSTGADLFLSFDYFASVDGIFSPK
ncbi:MAG TPA: hypothetical protein VLA03_10205, partial [Draconibacterium sp.]|nr:hypothetical protein [Draconibacterium sp.]